MNVFSRIWSKVTRVFDPSSTHGTGPDSPRRCLGLPSFYAPRCYCPHCASCMDFPGPR